MLIEKILKDGGILKPGKDSTEWSTFKAIAIIGVMLILWNKFQLSQMTPEQIIEFADSTKLKFDEYLGSIMILGGAVAYMLKRGLLKYFEIKEMAAAAIKQQELIAQQPQQAQTPQQTVQPVQPVIQPGKQQ